MALGKAVDLTYHRWKPEDAHRLLFFYAPLLYLRKRYRLGCALLHKGIKMRARTKGWAFNLLWHIYKPLLQPETIGYPLHRLKVLLIRSWMSADGSQRQQQLLEFFQDSCADLRLFGLKVLASTPSDRFGSSIDCSIPT